MTTDELDADLDRLRAAHLRVPDPDPEHVRHARLAVLATIPGAATTRTATPQPARRATPVLGNTKAPPPPATTDRVRPRRSRWGFAGAAGALAIAAVATVALLPDGASDTLDRATSVGLASARAAAERACAAPAGRGRNDGCLQALSVVAGDWNPPGDGDVLYQRSWRSTSIRYLDRAGRGTHRRAGAGVWALARGAYVDSWVAPDGSGRTEHLGEGAAYLPSAADRRGWRAAGSPSLPGLLDGRSATGEELSMGAPGGGRSWPAGQAGEHLLAIGTTAGLVDPGDPLEGLSTDPVTLRGQLRELAWRQRVEIAGEPTCAKDLRDCQAPVRRNIDSAFGSIAVGLLAYPATPRALREALLAVLAGMPGYASMGTTTLPDGRSGAAVLLPPGANDGQDVLVLATATARPIAEGASADRTLQSTRWTALHDLRTARVGAVGDRP
jgi:hypothetical protein